MNWFKNDICSAATFPVHWDGEAFFNGVAAEFAAVADRFFKGADMLENMVNAKAILAASPVEAADQKSMLEALAAREEALRSIRDMVDDNYYLDTGTRTGQDRAQIPLPAPGEAGLWYRYTPLSDNRWYVETVVPRNVQSTAIEPLSLDVEFLVEPGSEDEAKIEDWRSWGIPFNDVMAETHCRGGPLADAEPRTGLVSFMTKSKVDNVYPDLSLATAKTSTDSQGTMVLAVREVTRGVVGDGLRVVGVSRSGLLEIEIRSGSDIAPNESNIRLVTEKGLDPAAVRDELTFLDSVAQKDTFRISIAAGPVLLAGNNFTAPPAAQTFLAVATDLARLQAHTSDQLRMPDMKTTNGAQLDGLHRLAEIYDGKAYETTWDRLAITVGDPAGLRQCPLDGTGWLVQTQQPTFNLGATAYTITKTLAVQHATPTLAVDVDWDEVEPGAELELAAGADDRLVVAAVVDDTPRAGAHSPDREERGQQR